MKVKQKMKKFKGINKKLVINGALSVAMTVASIAAFYPKNAEAEKTPEQLEKEIQALQAQINDAETQAKSLRDKTQSLQSELAGIEREKTVIQSQIAISKAQYEKLQIEIKKAEQDIANNRKALGTILAEMSLDDSVSPIERLAGSSNISKALDSFEYKSAVKNSLVAKVESIKTLKKQLDAKNDELKLTLENQKNSESALQAKIKQQNELIAKTQGEEAEYSKYAESRGAEKLKLQNQQQALLEAQARRATGGAALANLGGSTTYPWNDSNCYVDANAWSFGGADGNGTDGMGYGCRQCVSYVAWKLLATKGIRAVNWGNANHWPASARRAGFKTGSTPKAGAMGVISAGQYGHIVWIESVDGGYVTASQFNWKDLGGSGWGHYSKVRVPASTYDTYIYFD